MDMDLFSIIWICGFCFGGTICIGFGILLKYKLKKLIVKCTSNCKGILSEIYEESKEHRNKNGRYCEKTYYFPIYEFEVNGKKYKIRDTAGNMYKESFHIGDTVEIKYNPENPNECYKEGDVFSKVWIIFLVIGIICVIEGIGIGLLIRFMF